MKRGYGKDTQMDENTMNSINNYGFGNGTASGEGNRYGDGKASGARWLWESGWGKGDASGNGWGRGYADGRGDGKADGWEYTDAGWEMY